MVGVGGGGGGGGDRRVFGSLYLYVKYSFYVTLSHFYVQCRFHSRSHSHLGSFIFGLSPSAASRLVFFLAVVFHVCFFVFFFAFFFLYLRAE